MTKLVKVVAAETTTRHDGTSMIVLTKGKSVEVAESSLAFLREHKLIVEDADNADDQVGGDGDDKIQPHARLSGGEGGWWTIDGHVNDKDEPIKVRGIEAANEIAEKLDAEAAGDGAP